ncbi:acid proteinase [Cubamyces sp. BRFM 1775]|nr:acid proteinase [Cubamyces sp. BRFM 1775]
MLFSALLFQIFAAATALAIPTSSERRAERTHLSHPNQIISGPVAVSEGTNATQAEFSSNWAGAVLVSAANTYKSVTGTFVVPTPREPSGGTGFHSASAWVGIDGDTCQTAILQTGIDLTVSGSSVSYDAWYEWYPAFAFDFTGINIRSGDSITATVVASSLTSGTATIINHSTGQQVSHSFTLQPPLCQENAEWIVEDYDENGAMVPLANFGTVTFTGASAGTSSGTVGPAGATIINMEQGGRVLTSVSVSSSTVTVEYIGP